MVRKRKKRLTTQKRTRYIRAHHEARHQKLVKLRQPLVDVAREGIENVDEDPFGIIFNHRIPFTSLLSKNIYKRIGKGRFFINGKSRAVIEGVKIDMANELRKSKTKFYHNKVSIALHVEKPNASSDAINFIECIADIVKDVIDVDDRWFEIHSVRWMINRDDPKIMLTIAQENQYMFDAVTCTNCGRPFPITDLTEKMQEKFRKTGRTGRSKFCKDCKL